MAVSSSSEVVAESAVRVLNGKYDKNEGGVVKMNEPMHSQLFTSMLKTSISHWRQQGKKGVWIKIPIELANLIEPAVKEGFWYHYAEPTYLMLLYWIARGTNTLRANASHQVGVGAFVMNEKREVLVVQENRGRFQGTGIWKFPTGVVEEGEDICAVAVREVKEETSYLHSGMKLACIQATNGDQGKAGLGVIIRNPAGELKLAATDSSLFNGDVEFNEAEAMKLGINLAKEVGLVPFIVESDALNVVNLINKKTATKKELLWLIADIQELIQDCAPSVITYVCRQSNCAAHNAAKMALSAFNKSVWVEIFPPEIASLC